MKKTPLLLLLMSLLVMMTLLTGTSQAVMQSVGPTDPVTTLPAWYMDTNNLALVPCNDQDTPYCILGPPFDALSVPRSTITTTEPITDLNFPGEGFYYSAEAVMPIEGGADNARLAYVLEFAFLGGVFPNTGVTFLRTDLVQLNLGAAHANTNYRVTHPYGTFEFATDANGTSINGGNAIRFEDQPGTIFNYLPPLFKSAPNTNIGPFLRMASGGFIVDAATGKTYIGDALTPGPVTGGTNGNIFRIDRLSGPGGTPVPGAFWETPNFVLMGRVFTGQIPSPMTIDRVTYARDDATTVQVDVFASALPAALLSISGTGLASTSIPQGFPNTGKFFVDIPVGALPTGVSITNSLDTPSILYPVTMVDEVTISQSFYNPVTRNLTIKADSRDNLAPLPSLTVTVFGATSTLDATGTVVVPAPANAIPPLTVTVNSSKGGSATAFVSVVTPPSAPVAVDDAASTVDVTPVTIAVLANDTTTATFDLATLAIVASSANGTSVVGSGGTITFTPTAGFSGTTTFTYDIKDNFGQVSNTATVTVTVTGTVAAPASITVPATNATGSYSVSWAASATAGATYTLQESTDPLFPATAATTTTLNAVSPVAITGKANGTYYYRVKAVKTLMTDSAWVGGQVVVLLPPVAPASPAPTGIVATTTPSYTWIDSAGAASYDLITVVNGVTTTTNYLQSAICSLGACAVVSPALTNGSNVYWNVRANSAAGSSSYTATTWFRVAVIPVTPTSPVPTGIVATATPSYTWNDSVGATSYDLITVVNGVTTTTNYLQSAICSLGACAVVSPALTNGSNVYWNVRANSAAGSSSYTATTWFRVAVIPVTPTSPAPTGIVATATPTYSWNDSVGATSYDLITVVNGVTTTTNYLQSAICSLGACSVVSPALTNGSNVYWNVRANSAGGSSSYTATTWFRSQF